MDAWGHLTTITASSVTALHVAALEGDIRLIQALKEVGANLSLTDGLGNSAVHLLSKATGTSLLRLEEMEREDMYAITWMALQPGVDVNAQNRIGLTALHVASSPLAVHQLKSGGAEWMYVTMADQVPHLAMETTFLQREESFVSPLGTAYLFHPMDSFVSIGQQMILSYGLSESHLVPEDRWMLEWLRSQTA